MPLQPADLARIKEHARCLRDLLNDPIASGAAIWQQTNLLRSAISHGPDNARPDYCGLDPALPGVMVSVGNVVVTKGGPWEREWHIDAPGATIHERAALAAVYSLNPYRLQNREGKADALLALDSLIMPETPATAPPVAGADASNDNTHLTKIEKAMQIYLRDPNQPDREVARQVPCAPSYLSQNEQYQRLKASNHGILPRGRKSKDGRLESDE